MDVQSENPPVIAAQTRRERPTRAWYTVAVLIVAYVFAFLDRQVLSLLVEPLERDLSITDTQVSLLQGFGFAIFLSIAGLPIARWIDTRRRIGIVALGMTCWSAATACCGLASTYPALLLCRMGVGLGEASLTPAAHSMIADTFAPKRLGLAMGIYGIGTFIGVGLSFLIGAAIISALPAQSDIAVPLLGAVRPWQAVFLTVGVAGLPVVMWIATLREPARRDTTQTEGAKLTDLIAFFRSHAAAIMFPNLAAAFTAMSAYAASAWAPTFLVRTFDWSISEAGAAYGVMFMICGAVGVVAGGALSDFAVAQGRSDGRLLLIGTVSLAAAPFALVAPLCSTGWTALCLLVPVTVLSTMAIGVLPAVQQVMMPARMRAMGSAVGVLTVNLIGLGCGPTAVALLTDDVFADRAAISRSLAVALPSMLIVASVLAFAGRAAYRAAIAGEERLRQPKRPPRHSDSRGGKGDVR